MFLPQEIIVYLKTNLSITTTNEVVIAMPNFEALRSLGAMVPDRSPLPKPDGANTHPLSAAAVFAKCENGALS